MITSSVYWIRTEHHNDITCQGYIGVAKNATKRWWSHKWALKANRHENPILSNAVKKHGWDSLVKEVVLIGEEVYCYEIEAKLRPSEHVGWNVNIGGTKPPISKSRGENYISPLKGVSRPTPWLIGKEKPMPKDFFSKGGKAGKGRKQTPEQIAKRVASRKATLALQGRTV
jgi:hypothetical protein